MTVVSANAAFKSEKSPVTLSMHWVLKHVVWKLGDIPSHEGVPGPQVCLTSQAVPLMIRVTCLCIEKGGCKA